MIIALPTLRHAKLFLFRASPRRRREEKRESIKRNRYRPERWFLLFLLLNRTRQTDRPKGQIILLLTLEYVTVGERSEFYENTRRKARGLKRVTGQEARSARDGEPAGDLNLWGPSRHYLRVPPPPRRRAFGGKSRVSCREDVSLSRNFIYSTFDLNLAENSPNSICRP